MAPALSAELSRFTTMLKKHFFLPCLLAGGHITNFTGPDVLVQAYTATILNKQAGGPRRGRTTVVQEQERENRRSHGKNKTAFLHKFFTKKEQAKVGCDIDTPAPLELPAAPIAVVSAVTTAAPPGGGSATKQKCVDGVAQKLICQDPLLTNATMDETAKALECAGATCATVDEAQCCVEALKLALPSNHRQQQTCEAGFEAKKFTCANGVAESPESISCSSAECGEEDVDACCKEAPAATSGHETCLQGVEAKRICQATGSVHPEVTTDNMRADVKALHCGAEECTSDDEAQCCVSFTSCGAIKTENACGLQASEGHQCVWTQKKKDEMLKIEANGCPDRGVPPFCPRVWENDGAEQCLDCGALTDIYGGGLIDGLDYCAGQSDGKCELTRQVRCQGLVMSNGWSEGE